MKPAEKIQFIKNLIDERVQLSPLGPIVLQLNENPLFPIKDQMLVLKKLEHEQFVFEVEFLKRPVGVGASMWVLSTYKSHMEEPTDVAADLINVKLGEHNLMINKQTGMVRLNRVEAMLNPKSQEFQTILKLATKKNYQVTYADILGESVSKTTKRSLTFVIRNIKEALGILPAKTAKNKDVIKNIKGLGYKLEP